MGDPDGNEVAAVFDRAAATYDDAIPFFARFGERLAELAQVGAGDRVLDVACGRGASVVPAARRAAAGGHVTAVDLSAEMLGRLRTDLRDAGVVNVDVVVGDASRLDLPDDAFDAVLCGFAIMLVPDPVRAAAEMFRVARPGGRVAWSMPTGAGPEWSFFQELVGSFAPRAVRPVPRPLGPPPDLEALAEGAGFVDREILDEVEDFTFAEPSVWWDWVWSQGMRVLLEALDDDDLTALRQACFERLHDLQQPDGSVALGQRVRYLTATKP